MGTREHVFVTLLTRAIFRSGCSLGETPCMPCQGTNACQSTCDGVCRSLSDSAGELVLSVVSTGVHAGEGAGQTWSVWDVFALKKPNGLRHFWKKGEVYK